MLPQLIWSDELGNWVLEYLPPGTSESSTQTGEILPLHGYNETKAINARKQLEQALDLLQADVTLTENQLFRDYDPIVAKALAPHLHQPSTAEPLSHVALDPSAAPDSQSLRELILPFPTSEQGYRRIRIIGATGSGKTTLLRQMIGMHPDTEPFPSTASNKTTIANLELIFADVSEYRCVATFCDFEYTKAHIEDCIAAAVEACVMQLPNKTVADRLHRHRDQRFRLFQILGQCSLETIDSLSNNMVSELKSIDDVLTNVVHIASTSTVSNAINSSPEDASDDDWAILDTAVRESSLFIELVARTLDLVIQRIEHLPAGTVNCSQNGWPQSWTYTTQNKEDFLKTIRLIDSQHHAYTGKLVTPLVNGIRVQGPFMPRNEWNETENSPKLILLDGEGLGHSSGTVFSLPENFTEVVDKVDAVVLVDNALQPMQAASVNAFASIVASGHESKLHIVFTHMDQLESDAFENSASKEDHIGETLHQTLYSISAQTGASEYLLAKNIPERTFYVAGIHKPLPDGLRRTKAQLRKLLKALSASSVDAPHEPDGLPSLMAPAPTSKVAESPALPATMSNAAADFLKRWDGLVGYAGKKENTQHWTRVKALSRHIGVLGYTGYDWLKPSEDLNQTVIQAVSRHLYSQQDESGSDVTNKQLVDTMLRSISRRVHITVKTGLIDDRREVWKQAFLDFNGTGSTAKRAEAIHLLLARYSTGGSNASGSSPLIEQVLPIVHKVTGEIH